VVSLATVRVRRGRSRRQDRRSRCRRGTRRRRGRRSRRAACGRSEWPRSRSGRRDPGRTSRRDDQQERGAQREGSRTARRARVMATSRWGGETWAGRWCHARAGLASAGRTSEAPVKKPTVTTKDSEHTEENQRILSVFFSVSSERRRRIRPRRRICAAVSQRYPSRSAEPRRCTRHVTTAPRRHAMDARFRHVASSVGLAVLLVPRCRPPRSRRPAVPRGGRRHVLRPDDAASETQCTGLVNAAYPRSGVSQPCAWDTRSARCAPGGTARIAAATPSSSRAAATCSLRRAWRRQCSSDGTWDCYMPPVPSGPPPPRPRASSAPRGRAACPSSRSCGHERADMILNLTDSSNVEIPVPRDHRPLDVRGIAQRGDRLHPRQLPARSVGAARAVRRGLAERPPRD